MITSHTHENFNNIYTTTLYIYSHSISTPSTHIHTHTHTHTHTYTVSPESLMRIVSWRLCSMPAALEPWSSACWPWSSGLAAPTVFRNAQ